MILVSTDGICRSFKRVPEGLRPAAKIAELDYEFLNKTPFSYTESPGNSIGQNFGVLIAGA